VVVGLLGVAIIGIGLAGTPADAASGTFPMAYHREPGLHTFTPDPTRLTPACPEALAGTPGSDPATKVFNTALNTPASFQPGGTVHYIYKDNPHTNGGTQNFTIQDCVVAYAPGTFTAADFGPGGVLVNAKKNLLKGGTQLDGASLSGITAPNAEGNIYFGWTSPTSATTPLAIGTWVCNFARDIKNNHGGGGNRKVSPVCYQLGSGGPGTQVGPGPEIHLAYADDFIDAITGQRGTFVPNPWQGSPGITFIGCTAGTADCGTYDAGAIRIDNMYTVATLQLTAASVDIGPCHFQPWDTLLAGANALPGGSIILTQTGAFEQPLPAPCSNTVPEPYKSQNNFDTSEAAVSSNCDPSLGGTPVIHLTFSDGTVLNVVDTNKVLNTGGIDKPFCAPGPNSAEGTQWTAAIPY